MWYQQRAHAAQDDGDRPCLLQRRREQALCRGTRQSALALVCARVAPYRLHGAAIDGDIQHITGDGSAVRITCSTGTCGTIMQGAAHTPCASKARASYPHHD